MNLLDLPGELLIIILEHLDTPALYAVYSTCTRLKSLITDFNIVKQCSLSMNNMSSTSSLKLSYFKDVAGHLQELDLSGVPSLNKTSVLPVMKKLVNLRTLHIQFTDLHLMDFVEIHKLCPTIKDISINMMEFGNIDKYPTRYPLNRSIIPDVVIEICQETFRHMENVHFYTTGENALFTDMPQILLTDCEQLADLKVTAWRNDADYMLTHDKRVTLDKPLKYKQWFIHVAEYYHVQLNSQASNLENNFEFIVISDINRDGVSTNNNFISTGLKEFCDKNLNISYECETEYPSARTVSGKIDIMLWNKATNKFDDVFFSKLLKELKRILPASDFKTHVADSHCWDVQIIKEQATSSVTLSRNTYNRHMKRQRVAPGCYTLDFKQYKQIEFLRLQVTFKYVGAPVTLSPTSDYLGKLVHLTLMGTVHYSGIFFPTLFSTCKRLTTLHIISNIPSKCSQLISSSVKLSSSLKNLRIVESDICKQFLPRLSKCKTIEIVFIQDNSDEELKPGIDLLLQCPNLHVLYMAQSKMSDACVKREMKNIEMLKTKRGRQSVRIVLNASNNYNYGREECYKVVHGDYKYTLIKGQGNALIFLSRFPLKNLFFPSFAFYNVY